MVKSYKRMEGVMMSTKVMCGESVALRIYICDHAIRRHCVLDVKENKLHDEMVLTQTGLYLNYILKLFL